MEPCRSRVIFLLVAGSEACAWMVAIIGRTQVAIGDVRVDLSRRNVAVTQQRLDRAGVGAVPLASRLRGEFFGRWNRAAL